MDMMRQFKILFIVLLISIPLFARDAQELFRQGNQFYQQGKYEQAIAAYKEILQSGYESGALYFNLGNAYYKLNKIGLARLNYERAARFLKGDEALNENLDLLKYKLVDKIPQPPEFFLFKWREAVLKLLPVNTQSWILVALFALLLAAIAWRRHQQRRGQIRNGRSFLVISVVVFLFFLTVYLQKVYVLETDIHAVIIKPMVTVYAEPNTSGTEVFVLHEGTKIKVLRTNGNWQEIRLSDGKTGWLEIKNLETI